MYTNLKGIDISLLLNEALHSVDVVCVHCIEPRRSRRRILLTAFNVLLSDSTTNKIIKPCSRLSTVRGWPQYHAHRKTPKNTC